MLLNRKSNLLWVPSNVTLLTLRLAACHAVLRFKNSGRRYFINGPQISAGNCKAISCTHLMRCITLIKPHLDLLVKIRAMFRCYVFIVFKLGILLLIDAENWYTRLIYKLKIHLCRKQWNINPVISVLRWINENVFTFIIPQRQNAICCYSIFIINSTSSFPGADSSQICMFVLNAYLLLLASILVLILFWICYYVKRGSTPSQCFFNQTSKCKVKNSKR